MGDDRKFEFTATLEAAQVADYLARIADGIRGGVIRLTAGERELQLGPVEVLKLEIEAEAKPEKGKGSIELEISWKSDYAATTQEAARMPSHRSVEYCTPTHSSP